MNRFKKIFYFILGEGVVPVGMGILNIPFFGVDGAGFFYRYFLLAYLVCYFLFPVLYRGKMEERFPNRYAFYGVMYLAFWLFGIWLYFA